MTNTVGELPAALQRKLKRPLLADLKGEQGLDIYELSLFEWYARENAKVIEQMLSVERAYIQEQVNAGSENVNDSGMVAVEYYIKRARYADLIYMASLLEIYLDRACEKLALVLGDQNVVFRPEELVGDKWTKRKKFLERYGKFSFPETVWADLRALILVRNNLVHENGNSAALSQDEKNQIQKRPGIKADRHELVIEGDYVHHCFLAFQSLVGFIGKQIDQIVDRALRPQSVK